MTTRLSRAARRELIEQEAMALFAQRGYHATAVDEIARRAGVTPPTLYDHFPSKVALHVALLERTRDELLAMWRANLGGDDSLEAQVRRAFTAWAGYVQAHPYAPRVYFRETTGVPDIQAAHAAMAEASNRSLAAIVGALVDAPPLQLAMIAEVVRGGLTELAVWWTHHPDVAQDAIVEAAMAVVWSGLGSPA